jgi:outer membrane protein OmpA-like peptidoglycan-associated protein
MNADILSLAQQAFGGDFSKLAGQFLGESESSTQSAMRGLVPAALGLIAHKGATAQGASSLLSMLNGANLDASAFGNLAGLFSGGGSGAQNLLKAGTSQFVPALFGEKAGGLINSLAAMSGLKSSSATNLVAMVVPLIYTFLKKFIGENKLDANGLASLFSKQGPSLQGALDSRITGALGFAGPAAFLGGLGAQATDATKRAGAAVVGAATGVTGVTANATAAAAVATKSGLTRWLPWLIAAGVLLFLWNLFAHKPEAVPAPTPTATTPAPAIVASVDSMAKVYFDVGSAEISGASSQMINATADRIKKDGAKVDLTGYTDKTGDEAKNMELAKGRAKAVQDALIVAGIAPENIGMKPPLFVTGAANDAEARRVDISKQ